MAREVFLQKSNTQGATICHISAWTHIRFLWLTTSFRGPTFPARSKSRTRNRKPTASHFIRWRSWWIRRMTPSPSLPWSTTDSIRLTRELALAIASFRKNSSPSKVMTWGLRNRTVCSTECTTTTTSTPTSWHQMRWKLPASHGWTWATSWASTRRMPSCNLSMHVKRSLVWLTWLTSTRPATLTTTTSGMSPRILLFGLITKSQSTWCSKSGWTTTTSLIRTRITTFKKQSKSRQRKGKNH